MLQVRATGINEEEEEEEEEEPGYVILFIGKLTEEM
jgi:hypothetical protein